MCYNLGELEREHKAFRGLVFPVGDGFGGGDAVKAVVHFNRVNLVAVIAQKIF
jgi:hypothetical protein